MTLLTGTALLGDGSIWWVIGYALLLGAIGVRLLLDMWPCRLSTAALLAAGGTYAAAVPLRLGWLSVEEPVRRVMVLQGAAMGGHLLLLLAMGLHLRYVLADARGLLPPRAKKAAKPSAKKGTQKSPAADDPWVTVDSPHGSPQPVLRRASAVAAAAPAATPPSLPANSARPSQALRNRRFRSGSSSSARPSARR